MCKSIFKICSLIVLINVIPLFADGWGQPPEGWDDFKIGILNNDRAIWDTPMKEAIDAGIHIDYRYFYVNYYSEIVENYFGWKNYAADGYKGIKGATTIYLIQGGGDAISIVLNNAKDPAFMKEYFEGIKWAADSSNGYKSIFIIEPDVWTYLLQHDQANLGETNITQIARINDLGLSWLSEFDNKISEIPKAAIKTVREFAPDAYVGMLIGFWGIQPIGQTHVMLFKNAEDKVLEAADNTQKYLKKLLDDEKYKGDFIAVEKNGSDAGWWETMGIDYYMWNDEDMEKYLKWCKTVAQSIDLPLLGWQLCLGHEGLPNTKNSYEDTFFPYFYSHVDDFINTGFIGLLAGCANQDNGTAATIDQNSGDGGWFYDHLKVFNAGRPYNLNITTSVELPKNNQKEITDKFFLYINSKPFGSTIELNIGLGQKNSDLSVELFNLKGKKIGILFNGKVNNKKTVQIDKTKFSAGVYFVKVKAGNITKTAIIHTLY